MSVLCLRLATGAGALIAMVAALLVLTGALSARGGDSDIEIPGIPEEQIDLLGIKFLKPEGEPAMSAEQANDAALDNNPGGEVQSTTLVRLVNENADPPVDQLAWAVNFDPATVEAVPPSGPEGRPHIPTCGVHPLFHLVLVDASSGQVIYEIQRTTSTNAQSVGDCPNDTDPSPTKVPDASSP